MPLTSSGRPKRRTRKVVDYFESNTDSVKDLEKYLEKVRKEMENQARSVSLVVFTSLTSALNSSVSFLTWHEYSLLSSSPVVDVSMPVDAQVNLKLQNILMLLKRCCNHAYLIEYPLDPATGEFKVLHTTVHEFEWSDLVWRYWQQNECNNYLIDTDRWAVSGSIREVSYPGPNASWTEEKRAQGKVHNLSCIHFND